MKKLLSLLLVLTFILSGCAGTVTDEPEEIITPEEPIEEEIEEPSEEPLTIEPLAFLSLEEITAAGYYPNWMQPHSYIIYDEFGVPTITEGGELTEEEATAREDVNAIGYYSEDPFCEIYPNTKAEYDLHGFLQNVYYLYPDGNYNLSPPFYNIEYAEITYYEDITNFSQGTGVTVPLSDFQYNIYTLTSKTSVAAEPTTEPMDFPRYVIFFTDSGIDRSVSIDINNVFTSTLLGNGNYISSLNKNYFEEAEALFSVAKK